MCKAKFFCGNGQGDKLLASLLKKRRKKALITSLVIDKMITDHKDIKEAFVKYFSSFYKSKHVKQRDIENYLDEFKITSIPDKINEELNKDITEEIDEVIKQMKLNKSPGPDRFTAVFYKKLKEELIPILKESSEW